MNEKGSTNGNAQWSADPERGWVRAGERRKVREENKRSSDRNERYGRAKDKRKTN
jgi:hypothetical protein